MKKKVVISDIAKKVGVSVTTVSFILNGKAKEKRISDAVIDEVTKVVEELGYKPNSLAQSLRTGKTQIIGLMVEDIANPFFANVARLIEENAYKEGYRILYCSTENSTDKTKELINIFRDRKVDGYIITPAEGVEGDVEMLLKSNLPVVLFDRYFPDLETNYVGVDNFKGTYEATKHLLKEGFENIGFFTIKSTQTQMQERLEGYKSALKEDGKKPIIKEIPFKNDHEHTLSLLKSFIGKNNKIDAIVFGTNYLGVKGLAALKQLHLKIPQDIGVVSFDDHEVFPLYSPSITAISQPIEEVSKRLIRILLDELDSSGSERESTHKVVLPTQLIIRESSVRKSAKPVSAVDITAV